MKIFFYQAECGDAARITYTGNDNQKHNIFIDSGFERTFSHILTEEIEKIIINKESIDLWLISHIHDDHIGGVIKYLAAIERGELSDIVKDWYYNFPRSYSAQLKKNHTNLISEITSISQGDILFNYLNLKNKLRNYDITSETLLPNIYGMQITVLSPPLSKINKLRKKYSDTTKVLQRNENDEISEAVKSNEYDYNTKLEDFNLNIWIEDKSVENGSSISILTSFQGKRILWLADAHPSDIVRSLKAMGYSDENKIKCEWVKVTHHGSKGNNSNQLYAMIDCQNYLISANGENNHCLPTKEALARIIRNEKRIKSSHYKFYFTYDNKLLRGIFDNDGKQIFDKWNFEIHFLNEGKHFEFEL